MPEKRPRGFAAMDPEQQRQIASMGGRAAHQRGTAHEWNSREAADAGRKGGKAAHRGTARAGENGPGQNGRPASRVEEPHGASAAGHPGINATVEPRWEHSGQNGQAAGDHSVPQWSEKEYENRGMQGGTVTISPPAGPTIGSI